MHVLITYTKQSFYNDITTGEKNDFQNLTGCNINLFENLVGQKLLNGKETCLATG